MIKTGPKIVLCLASIVLSGNSLVPAQETPKPRGRGSILPFSSDLEETLEEAKSSGRPVVVAYVAAWCPVCREMKRKTYPDPVLEPMADRFLWVMVDIDRDLSTAREHGVDAVPTTDLVDPAGQTRVRILGFQSASELEGSLSEFVNPPGDETREGDDALAAAETTPPAVTAAGLKSDLIWSPDGYRSHSICFSHVGYGPLHLDSQSPFQALRFGISPRTPSTLGRGQYDARATATWVNVWAQGDGYSLDYEMLQASLALAYGITDTVEIEGEFQNNSRFGGEMDGLVQGFHDLFGLGQDGRDETAKGLFTFDLAPPGGQPAVSLDGGDRGTFSRSLQVSLQHNVTCGTAHLPAFSYSVAARVETANSGDLTGGSDVDFGVSVAVARRLKSFYLYLTLGYALFGRDEFRGIELNDSQFTALFALEWRFLPRQSFLLQLLRSDGVVKDFGPFDDASNEVTLGWKWEVVQRGVLEVGLIENLISFDNSPDFGFHVGYSQRF